MKYTSIHTFNYRQFTSFYSIQAHPQDVHVFLYDGTNPVLGMGSPHRFYGHVFVVITGGEVHFKIDNTDQHGQKNDFFYFSPNTLRHVVSLSEDCRGMMLSFTDDFLFKQGFHKNNTFPFDIFTPNSNYRHPLSDEDASLLTEALLLLYKKNMRRTDHHFGIESVFHDLNSLLFEIANLYKRVNCELKSQQSRKDEIYTRFLKLLATHFREQRGLKFYADQLFVTPNYLTKLAKETTGKTAGDLINEIVTLEAKILLQRASLSIAEVADQLYFGNSFIFSRFFKKQTGNSPSAYRKLQNGG